MKFLAMDPELHNYVIEHCDLAHPCLKDLAEETANLPDANMQVSADQGAFMHQIVKLTKAKRIIELGCFTGYSTICMGTAAREHSGKLISIDIDPEATKIARRYFSQAELNDVIDLRIGDAKTILNTIEDEWGRDSVDLVFIDADKPSMQAYYEAALRLVKPNGLILVDNVLWSGKVIDSSVQDASTMAIKTFNREIIHDQRVERTLLAISDGILMLRKK